MRKRSEAQMEKSALNISPTFSIPEETITFKTMRASGPGGQNINKVETKIRLIYDYTLHVNLPGEILNRLLSNPGITYDAKGRIVITEQSGRSQYENKLLALKTLKAMFRKAMIKPKIRKSTMPTRASKEVRLQSKKIDGAKKKFRQQRIDTDEE
jgi:ribosome-associated protein